MGIKKGELPLIVYIDPITGEEHEAPMTMNGIEIDPTDPEVIRRMNHLISFPVTVNVPGFRIEQIAGYNQARH